MKDVFVRKRHVGVSLIFWVWLAMPVDGMRPFAAGLMNGLFRCDCLIGLRARIAACRVKVNTQFEGVKTHGECGCGYS
jgi:hypothetical protein